MKSRQMLHFAALFLLVATIAAAQQDTRIVVEQKQSDEYARPQNFGIGLSVGLDWLNGDVQNNGTMFSGAKNPVNVGGNIRAAYTFLNLQRFAQIAVIGDVGLYPITAKANFIQTPGWGPYDVKTTVFNANIGIQSQFFPKSRLRPFVFGEIGFMSFKPQRTMSAASETQFAPFLKSDGSSLAIPVGFGFTYTASDLIDIHAFLQKAYNFTDNLDGWTSEINDNYPFAAVGAMFYIGGRQKEEAVKVVETTPVPSVVDTDGDGLTDEDERTIYKTDPTNKDTDGDGLTDGDEVKVYRTDPLNKDTDGDRLTDGDEVMKYHTDPLKKDTDGDGCSDGDEVLDMKTDPLKVDTDGDGLSDCDERNIYRTNPLVKDTDGDGVNDGDEIKNGTDPLKADVLKIDENTTSITLEGINFETNKWTILPESEEILTKALNTMRTNPTLKVEIGGHTDDVGKDAANQKLSERRANAVRDWLVNHGVDGARLAAKGYGEKSPIVPNTSVENRAKNRRIEFKIISR